MGETMNMKNEEVLASLVEVCRQIFVDTLPVSTYTFGDSGSSICRYACVGALPVSTNEFVILEALFVGIRAVICTLPE